LDKHPPAADERSQRGIRGSVVGFGITVGSQAASTSLTARFGPLPMRAGMRVAVWLRVSRSA